MSSWKICSIPGCNEKTKNARCEDHTIEKERINRHQRGSAHERGYTKRWRISASIYLMAHPFCVDCDPPRFASVVDHIIPHRGDYDLFWDETNWQSMCKHHHDKKTGRGE